MLAKRVVLFCFHFFLLLVTIPILVFYYHIPRFFSFYFFLVDMYWSHFLLLLGFLFFIAWLEWCVKVEKDLIFVKDKFCFLMIWCVIFYDGFIYRIYLFIHIEMCDFDIFISSKCSLIVVTVVLWILRCIWVVIWSGFALVFMNDKFDMIHIFT